MAKPTLEQKIAIKAQVIEDLSNGLSLTKALEVSGTAKSTWANWLKYDDALQTEYARARDQYADAVFEDLVDLSDKATKEDYNAVKLQIDTRKWVLGRMKPKKYSDRVDSGEDNSPAGGFVSEGLDSGKV